MNDHYLTAKQIKERIKQLQKGLRIIRSRSVNNDVGLQGKTKEEWERYYKNKIRHYEELLKIKKPVSEGPIVNNQGIIKGILMMIILLGMAGLLTQTGIINITGYAVSDTFSISISVGDNVNPNIEYVDPTPEDEETIEENKFSVNVSVYDINDIYAFTNFDNSLVGWWRMDNDSSVGENDTHVYDWSGNGNNGTAISGANPINEGKFGGSYNFSNPGLEYINIPQNNQLDGFDQVTISLWWNKNPGQISGSGYGTLITSNEYVNHPAYKIMISGDGNPNVNVQMRMQNSTGTTLERVAYGQPLASETWHHTVLTYNGTIARLYTNGEQIDSSTAIKGPLADDTEDIRISGTRSNWYWNGSIDEVLLFNRSLSPEEVEALYNASAPFFENNYTEIENGEHTIQSFIIDEGGNKNETEERTITIDSTYGRLLVDITDPKSESTITQNETFWINATVTCEGITGDYDCGLVAGRARYNGSSTDPDTRITNTTTATPFRTEGNYNYSYTNESHYDYTGTGMDWPLGITYDYRDNSFWAVDYDDDFLYHINTTGGNMSGGFGTDAGWALSGYPWGITFDARDNTFWIYDADDNYVYHLDSDGTNLTDGFAPDSAAANIAGIAIDPRDGTFWAVDGGDYWMYHINTTGGNMSGGFDLTPSDWGMQGLTIDTRDMSFWVLDTVNYVINHYSSEGNYISEDDINYDSSLSGTLAIAFNSQDNGLYVLDYSEDELIKYATPKPNENNPQTIYLQANQTYNVSWLINTTGNIGTTYKIDVYFNSSYGNTKVEENNTEDRTVKINSQSAPTISAVDEISATTPFEGVTRNITFSFNVTDDNGYEDIDMSSAEAYFSKSGESTRSNTSCVSTTNYSATNTAEFECTVGILWYDGAGSWTVNVTASDIGGIDTYNETTSFTYNTLYAFTMTPTSLTWTGLGVSDTNTGADDDPITINNTGNAEGLDINITAYHLVGEDTPSEYIYAENFSVSGFGGGFECDGTILQNATSTIVGTATLNKGVGAAGEEEVYFCIKGIHNEYSAQDYTTAAYGEWTIEIISSNILVFIKKILSNNIKIIHT